MLQYITKNLSNLGKQSGISRFIGKFSKSSIARRLRFGNIKKQIGRSLRDLEPMVKDWRLVRFPIDEGRANLSVFCPISENFQRPSQPSRKKRWRDFKLRILGMILRFSHPTRLQYSSASRSPTDWWISTKFLHLISSRLFMFGAITDKSGNLEMFLQ